MEATASNSFRERLRVNQGAGRYTCVRLTTHDSQVPSWVRERHGSLLSCLGAIAIFNHFLIQEGSKVQGAAAYRVSLMAYADHGAEGLEILQKTVGAIRSNCREGLVLLDAPGWWVSSEPRPRWSSKHVFEYAAELGADAVVISPCAGVDDLRSCFDRAAAEGMEVFVSCRGCGQNRVKTCPNFHLGSCASGDEWAGHIVGHLLSREENGGVALVSGEYPRLIGTRSSVGGLANLMVPWETVVGKNVEGALWEGLNNRSSGLIVEVSPETFCRDPTVLSRINKLMAGLCRSFAA